MNAEEEQRLIRELQRAQPQERPRPAVAAQLPPAAAAAAVHDETATATASSSSPIIMQLTSEELQWAHTIKQAVLEDTHYNLRPISDMECAQWAIVTLSSQPTVPTAAAFPREQDASAETKLQSVLERIYKMQCFREQYKLSHCSCYSDNHKNSNNSRTSPSNANLEQQVYQEGMQLMHDYLTTLMPGNILSIDYSAHGGHYIMVHDYACFFPSRINTPAEWRTFMGASYYMLLIMHSHFTAIRQGVASIAECDGMSWANFDQQLEETWMLELFQYYPLRHRESLWLRTPTVANVLVACLKQFMTADHYRNFHLGCTLEGYEGRINTLFQTPTREIATQELLQRIGRFLKERLHHEATFRLPDLSLVSSPLLQQQQPRQPVQQQPPPPVWWNE